MSYGRCVPWAATPPSSHLSVQWLGADPNLPTSRKAPIRVSWPQRDFGDQHRSFKPPTLKLSLLLCCFAKNVWQDFSGTLLQMLFPEQDYTMWQATVAGNWSPLSACVCPQKRVQRWGGKEGDDNVWQHLAQVDLAEFQETQSELEGFT